MKTSTQRWRRSVALALMGVGIAGLARAQPAPLPAERGTLGRLDTNVAYSLFLLSNGAFTSLGDAKYSGENTSAKLEVYNLPLTFRFGTGLLGPVELRLEGGYGEAKTVTRQVSSQGSGLAPGALAAERQYFSLWKLRFDIGRPILLTSGLVLTPFAGLGTQRWSGKLDRGAVGAAPLPSERVTFWADTLLVDAGAALEYQHRWGALSIRPGASVNYVRLSSASGRATYFPPAPAAPQRGKASIDAESTILRGALSIDGPLGFRVRTTELRWQTFVVGNYSTAGIGLFRWTVELGAAIGADLGPLGRSVLGFDPGELFVGVSYIAGENLSGVRGNFGFRF